MTNSKEVLEHYRNQREQEIRKMKIGPRLSALVGEQVMGDCRHEFRSIGPNVWNHQCTVCGLTDSNFTKSLYTVGIDKKYSEDIKEAWGVVEEMHKRGFLFVINLGLDAEYTAAFLNTEDFQRSKFQNSAGSDM